MMLDTNTNFPCRGCTDRAVGCHGYCKAYIQEKERIDAAREKRNIENEKEAVIDSYKKKVAISIRKRSSTGNWKRRR